MAENVLTAEAEKTYLDKGGTECPFCGSDQINESIEDGADTLSTLNDCENCGQHWRAYYELFGIEPVEEDE
jgi:uncharacterized Zn finger protein